VLLSVGRLEANKGFDVLAEALARAARAGGALAAADWRWVLVGAGPQRRAPIRAHTFRPSPRTPRPPRLRLSPFPLLRVLRD